MSFSLEDDSVAEETAASPTGPSHPTDPFLNPRRSTAAAPSQAPTSSGATALPKSLTTTISVDHPRRVVGALDDAAERTDVESLPVVKRRQPDAPAAPVRSKSNKGVASCRPPQNSPPAAKARPKPSARGGKKSEVCSDAEEDEEASFTHPAGVEKMMYDGCALLQDGGGGGGSDDDAQGDAEEKALIAAARATVPDARGASSAASPHPWLVTDAFHVSLWYVLRYAGSALRAADLWACRAMLALSAALPLPPASSTQEINAVSAKSANLVEIGTTEVDAESNSLRSSHPGTWTWTGTEESELLLRLVLRKPHAFTGRHLEARYGDWLHVQTTLTALTGRHFLWWASRASMERPSLDQGATTSDAATTKAEAAPSRPSSSRSSCQLAPGACAIGMSSATMLEQYDGARIAQMVLHGNDGGMAKRADELAALPSATEELVRVLQAVRGAELRLFLTALRHASKAHKGSGGGTSTHDASSFLRHDAAGNNNSDHSEETGTTADRPLPNARSSTGGQPANGRLGNFSEATYKCMPLGDNSLHDAIPGRKRDMIRYFVERRYSLWAPTLRIAVSGGVLSDGTATASTSAAAAAAPPLPSTTTRGGGGVGKTGQNARRTTERPGATLPSRRSSDAPSTTHGTAPQRGAAAAVERCFRDMADEAQAVAKCWDTHVGPVYAPHTGLKTHLVWMTEIFHVLTSSGVAGGSGQQGLKPHAATAAVAAPPTLLMLRPQLLLLLQSLSAARQLRQQGPSLSQSDVGGGVTAAADEQERRGGLPMREVHQKGVSAAFLKSVPHALLPRWLAVPVVSTSSVADFTSENGASLSVKSHLLDSSSNLQMGGELADEVVICSTRSFRPPDVDDNGRPRDDALSDVPPAVQLFGTTAMLLEYRAALYTHRTLYEVTERAVSVAQRFRARNEAFVSHMYKTVVSAVRAGVAVMKRHPLKRFSPAHACEATRFAVPFVLSPTVSPPSAFSLDAILYRRGNHAEHLLLFTPLFRWFACLELLYQVLQSAHRYAQANECLHFLLDEPVYVLHHLPECCGDASQLAGGEAAAASRAVSPVTYAFRYKTHKRGEWLSRLAQNLMHLKRYPEALAILEEAQTGYCELAGQLPSCAEPTVPFGETSNATAAALCRVLTEEPCAESQLPVGVQRRGRMLRVLWPCTALRPAYTVVDDHNQLSSIAFSPSPSLALFHAAWEFVRDRYCRRHDRLTLERSLAMLHRRVRQWTPLAAHRQLTTQLLAVVVVRHIGGVRDAMDCMLWREPSGGKSDLGLGRATTARAITGAKNAAAQVGGDKNPRIRTSHRPSLPVELFVLEHFLRKWNQQGSGAAGKLPSVGRKRQREARDTTLLDASALEERSIGAGASAGRGPWCGAHCEGQWIRCLAHTLLWDCYWAYPSVSAPVANANDAEENASGSRTADPELLWLSAFQGGPLDATTPINFLLRRRALVAARLAQLERCSREELLCWVAAHIKADDDNDLQASPPPIDRERHALSDDDDDDDGAAGCLVGNAEESLKDGLFDKTENRKEDAVVEAEKSVPFAHTPPLLNRRSRSTASLPSGQAGGVPRRDGSTQSAADSAASSEGGMQDSQHALPPGIPEAWKVPVGSLPLLDILRVLPLPPLWRLLRCLYMGSLTEGVPLRFSGFPDLVFWRRSVDNVNSDRDTTHGLGAEQYSGSTGKVYRTTSGVEDDVSSSFCLMEVKSPGDTLSTKQIAVNDLLHRCGFEVCVLRVDAVHDNGEPVSTKKLR